MQAEDWVARDMLDLKLGRFLQMGRIPDGEFVVHGTISRIEEGYAIIKSRLLRNLYLSPFFSNGLLEGLLFYYFPKVKSCYLHV